MFPSGSGDVSFNQGSLDDFSPSVHIVGRESMPKEVKKTTFRVLANKEQKGQKGLNTQIMNFSLKVRQ